jgi:hypothetical protein
MSWAVPLRQMPILLFFILSVVSAKVGINFALYNVSSEQRKFLAFSDNREHNTTT